MGSLPSYLFNDDPFKVFKIDPFTALTNRSLLRIAAPVIIVFLGKVRLTTGKQGSHLILLTHDGTEWSALGRRDVALARETVFNLSKEQTTHQGQPKRQDHLKIC